MSAIDALQKLQTDMIRKSTNGSVFVADTSAPTIDETTLFDSTTGDLALAGLPSSYTDLGYLSDAGAQFTRNISTSDTTSWQSVTPTRSDVTSDITQLQCDCHETKMSTIGIYLGKDPSTIARTANGVVRVNRPATPTTRNYRVLAVSVDETNLGEVVIARYLPNAKPINYGNQSFGKGNDPVIWGVTLQGYVDNAVGTAESYIFGGAGWKARLVGLGLAHVVTVSTTSSNTTVTATTGTFSSADVGKFVSGAGIPAAATIASVTDSTHAVLSAAATATATGVALTVG